MWHGCFPKQLEKSTKLTSDTLDINETEQDV